MTETTDRRPGEFRVGDEVRIVGMPPHREGTVEAVDAATQVLRVRVPSGVIEVSFRDAYVPHRRLRPRIQYDVGQVVRVIEGPFADFTGVVESVDFERQRLRVAIMVFGRSTPQELDFSQVQKE